MVQGDNPQIGRTVMEDSLFSDIELINQWLDDTNHGIVDPAADDMARILKVAEEMGEVSEAYIGFLGQNPRKGRTHTMQDVLTELADVVVTALCAMQHFTNDAAEVEDILAGKIGRIITRSNLNSGNGRNE